MQLTPALLLGLTILGTSIVPPVSAGAPYSFTASDTVIETDRFEQTTNETVFKRVDTNRSAFVAKLNLSLFTTFFQPGSVLRVTTGGAVDGQRVVWFDIGIARGSSGFVTQTNMTMQFPGFTG